MKLFKNTAIQSFCDIALLKIKNADNEYIKTLTSLKKMYVTYTLKNLVSSSWMESVFRRAFRVSANID